MRWQLAAESVLSSRDSLGTERWSPATAVQHGRSLMVVAVEAGDAPSDSIDVTVVDGVLTARGVDPNRAAFLEAWKLPEDADVGKITATVACGYLVITVPRADDVRVSPGVHPVPVAIAPAGAVLLTVAHTD